MGYGILDVGEVLASTMTKNKRTLRVVINMHETRYFYASKSHTKDKSLKNNIMYNILQIYCALPISTHIVLCIEPIYSTLYCFLSAYP